MKKEKLQLLVVFLFLFQLFKQNEDKSGGISRFVVLPTPAYDYTFYFILQNQIT